MAGIDQQATTLVMPGKAALADVTPIESIDITTTIANGLRELLAMGRFAPGEQITEASIASAFGVSRGPVREALKRLIEQGLLKAERNRGVFVPVLSLKDIEDIYRLRGVVESAALAELIKRADPAVWDGLRAILSGYRDCLDAEDWDTADEHDMAFHRQLVHASGSQRLIYAFETVAVETRMCLRTLVLSHPEHPDMHSWHVSILEAAERGDIAAAHAALEFHNKTVLADLAARERS